MTNDKTIKQLADELGFEKHIIKYQVKKLSGEYLENRSGVIYIKPKGIAIIKGILSGEKVGENADNSSDKVEKDSLVSYLLKEVEEKNNQIKDFQKLLENQQKLLDQQQILTLQTNKKIEELELKSNERETQKNENDFSFRKDGEEKEEQKVEESSVDKNVRGTSDRKSLWARWFKK